MRNVILAACAAFFVAGCSNIPRLDAPAAANLTANIKAVQSYTQTACKFLPTVATIASIINVAAGEGISTIGAGICNALTIAPLADGPGKDGARYHGVILQGVKIR